MPPISRDEQDRRDVQDSRTEQNRRDIWENGEHVRLTFQRIEQEMKELDASVREHDNYIATAKALNTARDLRSTIWGGIIGAVAGGGIEILFHLLAK